MAAGEQKGGGQFSWEHNGIIIVEKNSLPFRLAFLRSSCPRRSLAFSREIHGYVRRFDACQFFKVEKDSSCREILRFDGGIVGTIRVPNESGLSFIFQVVTTVRSVW